MKQTDSFLSSFNKAIEFCESTHSGLSLRYVDGEWECVIAGDTHFEDTRTDATLAIEECLNKAGY